MLRDWWRRLREDNNTGGPGDDPNTLLTRAQNEMNDLHARNRERAVQAITQKNNLQQMVDDLQKKIRNLEEQANRAEQNGNRVVAADLRSEARQYETSLESKKISLAEAIEASEQIKQAIKREEETIRRKTAEALALRAEWRSLEAFRGLQNALGEAGVPHCGDRAAGENGATLAQQEAAHEYRRDALVKAITHKNNLIYMCDDCQKKRDNVQERAQQARERGDTEMEYALLREVELYEASVTRLQDLAAQAERITEQAKRFVLDEEKRLQHLRDEGVAETPSPDDAPYPDAEEEADALAIALVIVVSLAILILLLFLLLR